MSNLKWPCNLQLQGGGAQPPPLVRTIHIPAQAVVGKRVHGVVVVTNGVGEDQERVLPQIQAGAARRVLLGIRAVVRGVVQATGIFKSCKL